MICPIPPKLEKQEFSYVFFGTEDSIARFKQDCELNWQKGNTPSCYMDS